MLINLEKVLAIETPNTSISKNETLASFGHIDNQIKDTYNILGHKDTTIDQVKEEEDAKPTMEQIDIPNDQEETYMKNDTTKISYQLGSSTFIKACFLVEEKISNINLHIENDGLESFFQNNHCPITNRIFQSMSYQGKGLGIHEQGIREPI